MIDKLTLDTNILIYAFGKQNDARKQIAKEIISKCNIICNEYLNPKLLSFYFYLLSCFKLLSFILI